MKKVHEDKTTELKIKQEMEQEAKIERDIADRDTAIELTSKAGLQFK